MSKCSFGTFRISSSGQHNGATLAKMAGAKSFEVKDGVLHMYQCTKDPERKDFQVKDGADIIVLS